MGSVPVFLATARTSPNMIIEGALREHGLAPFNFFSWTPFGLAALAAAVAFVRLG